MTDLIFSGLLFFIYYDGVLWPFANYIYLTKEIRPQDKKV